MLNTVCKALAGVGITCTTSDVEGGVQTRFMEHVANYGISYGTQEEYSYRMQLFAKRDAAYIEINNDPENTFVVGHNMFSTMTEDESKKWTGRVQSHNETLEVAEIIEITSASVDWRKKGAVNPITSQAQCASCWAFAMIAAVEGAHFIASGNLEKFSEQQIVDCADKRFGCQGGNWNQAFEYAMKHDIETNKNYPYVAKNGICQAKNTEGGVKVVSHMKVQTQSATALKSAVQAGPTCISVDALDPYFQGYKGGILNTDKCGHSLDHSVIAVGFGSENGHEYVIVRNSWGGSWGEEGYIRMSLEVTGHGVCGILDDNHTVITN